jgi:DNA polymerase-3 subunit delta'
MVFLCYNSGMAIAKKDSNWPLVGNRQIIEYLKKSIITNHIAGCYIFYGPSGVGKGVLAEFFAKSLACRERHNDLPCEECDSCQQANKGIHSDITILKKDADKKNVSVEQVREFIRTLSMSSFLNSYKIGIIKQAEDLSETAFNALLKTIEEPKEKVTIILTTAKLELLLPTIVSRSQTLHFNPVKAEEIYDYLVKTKGVSRSLAKNFSNLCFGRPALAVKFAEDKDFLKDYQEKAGVFLEIIKLDYNQRLKKIEKLIGSGLTSREHEKSTEEIIEIWQNLVRDLLLIQFEQTNLIQHQIFEKELKDLAGKMSFSLLLKCVKLLNDARVYLKANVNYRVVLDNLSLQI